MREENTEEVIPAKHVTDAALTFQRKKKQFRYYTFVCMCTHVCVQRETTISISGTSQTTKKTCNFIWSRNFFSIVNNKFCPYIIIAAAYTGSHPLSNSI
jgi:hypothetical protein